jgi:hypothetical protein
MMANRESEQHLYFVHLATLSAHLFGIDLATRLRKTRIAMTYMEKTEKWISLLNLKMNLTRAGG